MKVFEVKTELPLKDEESAVTHTYVTVESNNIIDVMKYYTSHCWQYQLDLLGVKEVLPLLRSLSKNEVDDAYAMYEQGIEDEEL